MKTIFIVGLDETERDVIVDLTLKGSRKELPPFTRAKLPHLKAVSSLKEIEKKRSHFSEQFSSLMKGKKNVVVSGSLTAKTAFGFVPLFSNLGTLTPDMILLLEKDTRDFFVHPEYGLVKRKEEMVSTARLQQELNRQLAAQGGCPIHILQLEKGNVKKTLKTIRKLLVHAMK